ncbi:MAG: type VI secretion system-associated FHA domain protein TagH [Halomonas sp.]|uniref:type VI secretion system-associated FHA domain protein TagH n=1 Tax=Halomonas TaxID=2745 RepID=UPI001868E816|nr:type VI secretion system-associated FHA domain protein TagH [Halomonas colorata]
MSTNQQSALMMVITNSELLEGRSTSSHVFPPEGGTLGSASDDDWLLQDHARRVHPCHAEVLKRDGQFCLIDRSGHTFINQATLPIGRNRKVALRNGDQILVGEYKVKVHLDGVNAFHARGKSLSDVVDEDNETVDGEGRPLSGTEGDVSPQESVKDDPLQALGGDESSLASRDPVTALSRHSGGAAELEPLEDMPASRPAQKNHYASASRGGQHSRDSATQIPDIKAHIGTTQLRSRVMDEQQLDDLERSVGEQLEDRWTSPTAGSFDHLSVDPLLRGMSLTLNFRNTEEQHAFLEEAGRTLRATIEGLCKLQETQNDSKYPLRDRRLQPIEDNPLRLGQSYDDTAGTLFAAERSPVHLSAPEAVAESLRHQGQHQAAVEEAIGSALGAILDAFSPDALTRRFHAYRGASSRIDDEGSWAWEMYQHYYRELNSGRQQGFQKLFWEVFEQAYDQSVRRQQREAP